MNTTKGTEGHVKEEGVEEVKVETVEYRKPAGEDQEAKKEKVEVVHEIRDAAKLETGGGALAGAAAAVANTLQSAKDAISGTAKDKTKDKTTE